MTISLHAATVPSCLQLLDSTSALIDKTAAWCEANGTAPATLIGARLIDDMHPFAYQVKSARIHSIGAIEGVRAGTFSPDRATPPDSFAGLKDLIVETRTALAAIDPAEIDGFVGRDIRFVAGERSIAFRAEDFLLSFAQPNFYFHVTTAYAILRANGVPIGKRDYLGALRLK